MLTTRARMPSPARRSAASTEMETSDPVAMMMRSGSGEPPLLVGGAVHALANRVVRPDEDGGGTHEGGEADGGAHVVGEDQERPAEGPDAAVQGHAVQGGGHAVLPDPVVDVAAGGVRPQHPPAL